MSHDKIGAGIQLAVESLLLFGQVRRRGRHRAGDEERGGESYGVAGEVPPLVEALQDADEADGVHVPHRGGIGIVSHPGRVPGQSDDVAHAQRVGPDEVRLNGHEIAVARGEVDDGLQADLLLNQDSATDKSESLLPPLPAVQFDLRSAELSLMRRIEGILKNALPGTPLAWSFYPEEGEGLEELREKALQRVKAA